MAYLVFSANGEEIDRRKLGAPLVIGRSAECDVAVRDILLSRRHCRVEPTAGGWQVVDLQSKNGTRLGWERIERRILGDGDCLRVGRTLVRYHVGPFEPAPEGAVKPRTVRPADPFEALHGTVAGFVYQEEDAEPGDSEPVSPELAALAQRAAESESALPLRPQAGTAVLDAPPALGIRRLQRPMPVPQPRLDAQSRRAAYLRRMEDVSLQATPTLTAPLPTPVSLPGAQTDWKLVAMLLGACVITLAVAFVLKP